MPIYEFYSPDTHRIYSFFARSLAQGRLTPRCPDNPKARMERVVSRFAVTGRAKDESVASDPALDGPDPRMERVMAEMEREVSTMNEDHPDPRQLGRLMRKMAEATGQKVPETMEQMIQRLEKGEDPEKLEAEFGDAMGNLEELTAAETEASGRKGPTGIRRQPTRDPKLYEMRDYTPEG